MLVIDRLLVGLISLYQRFISPYKGFRCAHHARYQSGTCSNAVKDLIVGKGFFKSLPLIRARFAECRIAYEDIKANAFRADGACIDVSCADELCDCGGETAFTSAENTCDCLGFVRKLFSRQKLSSSAKSLIVIGVLSVTLVAVYFFYGRNIVNVMVTDLGEPEDRVFTGFSIRQHPRVKVLAIVDGQKIYSSAVTVDQTGKEYKLTLNKPLEDFQLDQLQLLEARVNSIISYSKKLEVFESPEKNAQGERFKYRLKRRWHF